MALTTEYSLPLLPAHGTICHTSPALVSSHPLSHSSSRFHKEYFLPHFTDRQGESPKREVTCSRPHSQQTEHQDLNPALQLVQSMLRVRPRISEAAMSDYSLWRWVLGQVAKATRGWKFPASPEGEQREEKEAGLTRRAQRQFPVTSVTADPSTYPRPLQQKDKRHGH